MRPEFLPIADALIALGYPRERVEAVLRALVHLPLALEHLGRMAELAESDHEAAHVGADGALLALFDLPELTAAFSAVRRAYA